MLRASLGLALLLAGCGGYGSCPAYPKYDIPSATFTASAGVQVLFPDAQITGKTMVIDRAAGTVVITYQRDGHRVKETWRIKGPTS